MLESFNSGKFEYKKLSLEEQKNRGILGRLAGVIADTKQATRNGRHYGKELWDKVFNNDIMKEKIQNRCCFGELGHPADREEVDPEKIAICLAEQPKIGSDGKIYGVFDILSTPNGKILKALCDYGCNIGVSSRGTGDLIDGYDGNEEVDPDTYQCEGWDAVLIPAVKTARPAYVTESLDTKRYNKTLRQALSESLDKASAKQKKSMTESLESLGISLTEESLKVGDKVKVKVDNNREGEVSEIKGNQVYVDMPDDGKPARKDSYYEQDLEKLEESTNQVSGKLYDKLSTYINHESPFEVDTITRSDDPDEGTTIEINLDTKAYDDEYKPGHYDDADAYDNYQDELNSRIGDLATGLRSKFNASDYDFYSNTIILTFDDILNESTKVYNNYTIEPAYFGNGFTVFYEGDEVYFQTEEEAKQFIDEVSGEANESLTEDMIDGSKSLNELVDEEESIGESREDKEDKEVVNNKSPELVAELKESLNKNKKLEADNLELQEQLSVCNAKEAELREQLAMYKQVAAKLSDRAKEIKPLKESLNEKDKVIATNTKKLRESKLELDSLRESKLSNETELESLNESLETTLKQLKASEQLVEKYKKSYKALKESYLETKAYSLGLQTSDVKRNLNESYKIADIDKVCQKLYENK